MSEEFEVFYEARFIKDREDPEYLASAAAEVQVGIRHLITGAAELGAVIDPERVTVGAVDHMDADEKGRLALRRGLFIRAYVVKGSAQFGATLTREDLYDAYEAVVSWGYSKQVREIVAAGSMNGKTLGPTLEKVEALVNAGKEAEAREYVAKVSAQVRKTHGDNDGEG